jgi:hypothetical protein
MVSRYQLLYISLTLVYEEIDDTLQVISIEAELITCRVSPTSSYTNVKLIYIITDYWYRGRMTDGKSLSIIIYKLNVSV